ncbi:MAG TPA: polyprenyl synthetase family protein [archaeon]|nr:polyprenyl synthetase family protein [archaeon]
MQLNTTEQFKKVLAEKREIVWAEIQKFLPSKEPKEFYKIVREYPERKGKYLRPSLVLLACEAFGGDPAKAVRTAAAMQTSEDWILIHDDWMDGSDMRREKPCLHKIYGDYHAINAGDALHMIMWKMLLDNHEVLGYEKSMEVANEFYNILLTTAEGQWLEGAWMQSGNIALTDEDWFKVADAKAGYYTITGPMRLGAIVAGRNKETLDKLFEFGIPFGRAFQLQDDILNVAGDEKKYGKEIGGDILEGKRTLILGHLMRTCAPQEKKKVEEIFAKSRPQKTEEEKNYVLDLMRKHGSIDYARAVAKKLSGEAKEVFEKNFQSLPETEAKNNLRLAVDFVVNRDV